MTQRNNVVPHVQPLTEEQFRAKLLLSLARMIDAHGEAQVALWLGVSVRHLGTNVLRGPSLPTADKLWNLLAYDPTAHDEIDGAYDAKNVHKDSHCSTDPLTRDMIALAHETAEDEAPDSPGGVKVTDHELLDKDEARLRRVYRTLGGWLARIEKLRAPALRSVG
jgi:hypothetical protein